MYTLQFSMATSLQSHIILPLSHFVGDASPSSTLQPLMSSGPQNASPMPQHYPDAVRDSGAAGYHNPQVRKHMPLPFVDFKFPKCICSHLNISDAGPIVISIDPSSTDALTHGIYTTVPLFVVVKLG